VHARSPAAKFAKRLGAAHEEFGEDDEFGGAGVQAFGGGVAIFVHARSHLIDPRRQPLGAQSLRRLERRRLGHLQDRKSIILLIRTIHNRIKREGILIGGRLRFLDQHPQHPRFIGSQCNHGRESLIRRQVLQGLEAVAGWRLLLAGKDR
jgi:hypothetical protein